MRAVTIPRYGGPEVLTFSKDFPRPEPGSGEVLVRVRACALNHLDLWVRSGALKLPIVLPHITGSDVAGEVAELGEGVHGVAVGDRVVVNPSLSCGRCSACLRGEESLCEEFRILGEHVRGGNAEYVVVPAGNLEPLPAPVGWTEAAAVPLVFMTAWRMVVTRGRLRPGEVALVLGAGGGVASAAIQIARLCGAEVIATTSRESKLASAQKLGADPVLLCPSGEFDQAVLSTTGGRGVDVVIDSIGAQSWPQSLRALRKGGRLVSCGATSGSQATVNVRHTFWRQLEILGSTMASRRELREVLALVWAGRLRPVIDRTYPLTEARAAHERLEARDQTGKIVLEV